MAQTAAEALIEQGARQMSIESTLRILTRRFPGSDADVNSFLDVKRTDREMLTKSARGGCR